MEDGGLCQLNWKAAEIQKKKKVVFCVSLLFPWKPILDWQKWVKCFTVTETNHCYFITLLLTVEGRAVF